MPFSIRVPSFVQTWLPVLAALGLLYYPTYAQLAEQIWVQDIHAHGPLILAMSAYLAWDKRRLVAAHAARPHPIGWPVLAIGLLFYAVGRSQDVMLLDVASQIPILAGLLLLTRGIGAVRALWFPLLYLLFMVPLPGFLVDAATGPLKLRVSAVAEQVLYMLDYPVARAGVSLSIGPYQLLVADACSGLYSMFSLSAVGVLYIHLMRHPGHLRNVLLLASILPIAFAANCLRVLLLAVVTYHYGEGVGLGRVHDLSSHLLFVVAILLMAGLDALLGLALASPPRAAARPPRAAAAGAATAPVPGMRFAALTLSLLAGVGMAHALTPTERVAAAGPRLDLESLVPRRIGEWRVDESATPARYDPETRAQLDRLYSQLLDRTYVDTRGRRVLLLIAYGGEQSDTLQVHKPEVCYPAQGFRLTRHSEASLETDAGPIPVRRLVAAQGSRVEPVTYWITIGDRVATSSGWWKLEQIKYGLTGRIPDGLLLRLSSLTTDHAAAYQQQDDFARALIQALPEAGRARLVGRPLS